MDLCRPADSATDSGAGKHMHRDELLGLRRLTLEPGPLLLPRLTKGQRPSAQAQARCALRIEVHLH